METEFTVDIMNATDRICKMIKQGYSYDDSMTEVSKNFKLTAKEMDRVQDCFIGLCSKF